MSLIDEDVAQKDNAPSNVYLTPSDMKDLLVGVAYQQACYNAFYNTCRAADIALFVFNLVGLICSGALFYFTKHDYLAMVVPWFVFAIGIYFTLAVIDKELIIKLSIDEDTSFLEGLAKIADLSNRICTTIGLLGMLGYLYLHLL